MPNFMGDIGKIIICPTPIGNLDDVSKRVIDALSNADVIYSEDTRVTAKLLNLLGISNKVKRLDENLMSTSADGVVHLAKNGQTITYCTDAGMPGLSDPGLRLVDKAHKCNVDVEVLPGPCAAINSYVAAGFDNPHFYFEGFLPKKKNALIQELDNLSKLNAQIIIYESPKRLLNTLIAIKEVFGDVELCVCRELTKIHEEVVRGNVSNVLKDFSSRDSIKGEVVIVINSICDKNNDQSFGQAIVLANFLCSKNMNTSDVCDVLMMSFGMPKNQAYDIAISSKKKDV